MIGWLKHPAAVLISCLIIFAPSSGTAAWTCERIAAACNKYSETIRADYGPMDNVQNGLCIGYMAGFADLNLGYENILKKEKINPFFCLYDNNAITTKQMINIYLRWMKRHPDQLRNNASVCFTSALHEALPCLKK